METSHSRADNIGTRFESKRRVLVHTNSLKFRYLKHIMVRCIRGYIDHGDSFISETIELFETGKTKRLGQTVLEPHHICMVTYRKSILIIVYS